jgi:uracil-DNA glycosylase
VSWNISPLQPHEAHDPFSNRCHTKTDREATRTLLTGLIVMIKPRRIVAIGRDAGMALNGLDITVEVVRHPSYGGRADFISGVNQSTLRNGCEMHAVVEWRLYLVRL